jgi:hypothetical protein
MAIPAGQRAEPDDPWLAVKVIVAAMVLLAFLSVIAPMFPLGPVR